MSEEEASPGPPRLLDRVRHEIRLQHYSLRTEEAYVAWIRRFILFHNKGHPSAMGAEEVKHFLSDLAVRANVAAATQNQALSAILFLYRQVLGEPLPWLEDIVHARKPRRLPVVLTRAAQRSHHAYQCGCRRYGVRRDRSGRVFALASTRRRAIAHR